MNRVVKVLPFLPVLLVLLVACSVGNGIAGGADKTYAVADVFKNRAGLDAKVITVKGKVVKTKDGIMGKNWLHIQDGTGDAGKKTNDLTITTSQALPKVGDTVVAKGTLHKDKDFGSGYFYEAIVEDATLKN
jgi:hypothetical protein